MLSAGFLYQHAYSRGPHQGDFYSPTLQGGGFVAMHVLLAWIRCELPY